MLTNGYTGICPRLLLSSNITLKICCWFVAKKKIIIIIIPDTTTSTRRESYCRPLCSSFRARSEAEKGHGVRFLGQCSSSLLQQH
jgi:hypothetical protein